MQQMHEAYGARWSEEDGVRLVRNYGDPAAEYKAARTRSILVERTDRSLLHVYGRDPVKMVQGLITNDIANAPATRAVYAAVLTPKGRMIAEVRVLRRGADLLIDTDVRALTALTAHLKKFVPPLFARFDSADNEWSVLTVCGPEARAVIERAFGIELTAVSSEDDALVTASAEQEIVVLATAQFHVEGFDLLVPRVQLEDAFRRLEAAGARPAGHATLEVLRVEAGRPQWARELDESTIPLEANLRERAISESKGCYTGQEVIVRILHRGHVNWILRRVLLGDVPAPPRGAPLVRPEDGKQVGRITSSVWSPQYGQTIALAYVRREIAPGARLALGEATGPGAEVASTAADAAPELQNDRN